MKKMQAHFDLAVSLARIELSIKYLIYKYGYFVEQLKLHKRRAIVQKSQVVPVYHRLSSRLLNFSIPQPSTLLILTSDNVLSREASLLAEPLLSVEPQMQPGNIASELTAFELPSNFTDKIYSDVALNPALQNANTTFPKTPVYRLKYDSNSKIALDYKPEFYTLFFTNTIASNAVALAQYAEKLAEMQEAHLTNSEQNFVLRDYRDEIKYIAQPISSELYLPDVLPYSPPSLEEGIRFSEKYYHNKALYFIQALQAYYEKRIKLIQIENGDLQIVTE